MNLGFFMNFKKTYILLGLISFGICLFTFRATFYKPIVAIIQRIKGKKTITNRVEEFHSVVWGRLSFDFKKVGILYPPQRIVLVGFKHENQLELWVSDKKTEFKHLKTYQILAASGSLGPKLKEGDMQVPEGLYQIESLNPNSLYHLALRLNYPNRFDKAKGKLDNREKLGCDIMIHGENCSIGCLAVGNEAIEELFILVAETGIDNISVIISPVDFRNRKIPIKLPDVPMWTPELYKKIKKELKKLKKTN